MNGWWLDPDAPGRGYFIEYAEAALRMACCVYADSGAPAWHDTGPLLRQPDGAYTADALRLEFEGGDRARLDWRGERVNLRHQYAALREQAASWHSPFSGWWCGDGRTFICEQLNSRLFAALLDSEGWLLFEAVRGPAGEFSGPWRRYSGGQRHAGPYLTPEGEVVAEGGRVAAENDGALRIRLPDGTSARFARLRASPEERALRIGSSRPLEVVFSAPEAQKPSTGLVGLSLEAQGGPAFWDTTFKLVIESGDARVPRFETPLHFDGWTRKIALFVNTHLLPNAEVPFTASLSGGGEQVWRHEFRLSVANAGPLAERVRESLRARNAPLVILDSVDSSHFDLANPALRPWFDRPDATDHIEALRKAGRIDGREEGALRQFVDDGYLVLEGAIEEPLLERIDGEIDEAIASNIQGYSYGSSQRIRNLHERYAGVGALWRHPSVMRILGLIFDVPARPCQTLTYVFGSQQDMHQDTVHLTPFPAGYMCGVWVALEDVKADSGELEVFPGTHRLPRVYMNGTGCPKVTDDRWDDFNERVVTRYRRMMQLSGGFAKVTYRPRRGTLLVWHENLLHGGSVRKDTSLSRRSIVSHYFAEGAIAFYDSTGLPGHME